MGHLETITTIFSLIGIYLKVLLSGRWQRKNTECTTWPLSNLCPGTPWQPQILAHPMTSAQGLTLTKNIQLILSSSWNSRHQQTKFIALVGNNLSIPHFWVEGQDGKEDSGILKLGTHKKSSSIYFLKSNLKGCQIAWIPTHIYQSKILIHHPHWIVLLVNTICQLSAPTFPLLR